MRLINLPWNKTDDISTGIWNPKRLSEVRNPHAAPEVYDRDPLSDFKNYLNRFFIMIFCNKGFYHPIFVGSERGTMILISDLEGENIAKNIFPSFDGLPSWGGFLIQLSSEESEKLERVDEISATNQNFSQ